MEIDYKAIGQRIKRLRLAKKLTQQQLAELSKQEPSNISHIERGATKLGLPTIVKIANVLEVTVDELLCDSLVKARPVLEQEIADILSECTNKEVHVLARTMRAFIDSWHEVK